MNQCCAIDNKKRCTNNTLGESKHCKNHHDLAIKLYLKYKKICEMAYNLDLTKPFDNVLDEIKHLNKCYHMFNGAYNARFEHRQYAFVDECSDDGHELQFVILQDKIKSCEDMLYEIYTKQPSNNDIDTNSDEYEDNTSEELKQVTEEVLIKQSIKNVKKQKKVRDNLDKELNEMIKENEKIYQRWDHKMKIHGHFLNSISKLSGKLLDPDKMLKIWDSPLMKEKASMEKIKDNNLLEFIFQKRQCPEIYQIYFMVIDNLQNQLKHIKGKKEIEFDLYFNWEVLFHTSLLREYLPNYDEFKEIYEFFLLNQEYFTDMFQEIHAIYTWYRNKSHLIKKLLIHWNNEKKEGHIIDYTIV